MRPIQTNHQVFRRVECTHFSTSIDRTHSAHSGSACARIRSVYRAFVSFSSVCYEVACAPAVNPDL